MGGVGGGGGRVVPPSTRGMTEVSSGVRFPSAVVFVRDEHKNKR